MSVGDQVKVLQVNCVYKKGSTGKIVYDIHKTLQKHNIESVICYGRGKKEFEENVYKVSSEILGKFNNVKSRFTGLQYGGSYLGTKKLINIIKKENPDVVHLHCINGFFVNIYKLIDFLKKNKIKTVLTLHAEFMHTANCGHAYDCEKWKVGCGKCPRLREVTNSYFFDRTNESWNKMKDVFEGFDELIVTSVSPWLEERAKESPILKDKMHLTILNGIDTEKIFYPREVNILRKKHNIKNEKIILHVTADFNREIKGGKYIIDLAKRMTNDNVKFIVIGNRYKNIELPSNIIDVGVILDQNKLAAYYSMADLTVIASKRETFSMVCAESLSCGTPVVGFKAGAPEQISLNEYSEFITYGDIEQLEHKVKKWINRKCELRNKISSLGRKTYSKEKMIEIYMGCYKELSKI